MPRTKATGTNGWLTLADVLHDLGGVSPKRIRLRPPPGKATEADLIRIQAHEKRHYELVDGVLVEKVMGAPQACVTSDLIFSVKLFLRENDLGFVMTPDGPTRLLERLVRMPDLSFVSWERMPTREYPATPIAGVVPNLAVEVLSEGNTRREMERKLKEYFLAGVELVWVVDPYKRTVAVYTAPDRVATLTEGDVLDGGSVLPGFKLPVKDLFARLPKDFSRRPGRRGKKGA
jgi:Uma2 family endonuclease